MVKNEPTVEQKGKAGAASLRCGITIVPFVRVPFRVSLASGGLGTSGIPQNSSSLVEDIILYVFDSREK